MRRLHPTREGLRWLLAGVGVVMLLWSSVLSAVLLFDHNTELRHITTLEANAKALGEQNHALLKHYEAEQSNLVAAGKEQAQFAFWLIEAQDAICLRIQASCPTVPAFSGVGK